MPGKNLAFTTRVDPVSPPSGGPLAANIGRAAENWWRRRVLPPGPLRLFRKAFIAIVGRADSANIVPAREDLKHLCKHSSARKPPRRLHAIAIIRP